ncbi:ATP-dependent DNA helicase PIF7-like protein, partial [Leptotrombidium deliense]
MAWTGIAAILLPCGRTAHKSFQLPLKINNCSTLYWNGKTKRAIRDTDVFIWDEASMIPGAALESIDIALRDICESDIPFGGKMFLLGGDFRQ